MKNMSREKKSYGMLKMLFEDMKYVSRTQLRMTISIKK